jgi:transcription initiation factor IIE alpha subunit
MSSVFDSKEFEFTCPRCKWRIKSRVADLKHHDYGCPHCGAKFDTTDFKHGMEEADREIERFKRSLGNIKIDIKL